jgi:hypothetical protein
LIFFHYTARHRKLLAQTLLLKLPLGNPCRDEIQKEQAISDDHERRMAVDDDRRIRIPTSL